MPRGMFRKADAQHPRTSFIYHDHVSWFPGASYLVEKLFREHYAERRVAFASGTVQDIPDRIVFFNQISTMKPEG